MRRLAIALVPLFLFACDREPVGPAATPSLDRNGAVTEKFEWYGHPIAYSWLDADRLAGEDPDVFMLGFTPSDAPGCNGGAVIGGIPMRERVTVTHPDPSFDLGNWDTWWLGEGIHDFFTVVGRQPFYMYRVSEAPDLPGGDWFEWWYMVIDMVYGEGNDEWCAFFKEGWVAAGTYTLHSTSADLTGDDTTPGVVPYHSILSAVLQGKDGTHYTYAWRYKAFWVEGAAVVIHDVDRVFRRGQ